MNSSNTAVIEPIETKYAGRLFRSRLEARWAVFYDAIRIPWVYELEGFKFANGVLYLPDFYLPSLDAYIEIKPIKPSQREEEKCQWLAEQTKKRVFMLIGQPGYYSNGGYPSGQDDLDGHYIWDGRPIDGDDPQDSVFRWDNFQSWCVCSICRKFGIEFDGRSERICNHPQLKDQNKIYTFDDPRLIYAYDLANSARF